MTILPEVLQSQTFAAAAGANAFEESILALSVPKQKLDNWCWAAITEGLERAYGLPARTQCAIVAQTLGQSCCPEGSNAALCNQPHDLDPKVSSVYRNRFDRADARTFAFIRARIRGGFPVVAQIDWGNRGVTHVVVISGFRRIGRVLDLFVWDPHTGTRSIERFERFEVAFRDIGKWIVSFETQGRRIVHE